MYGIYEDSVLIDLVDTKAKAIEICDTYNFDTPYEYKWVKLAKSGIKLAKGFLASN